MGLQSQMRLSIDTVASLSSDLLMPLSLQMTEAPEFSGHLRNLFHPRLAGYELYYSSTVISFKEVGSFFFNKTLFICKASKLRIFPASPLGGGLHCPSLLPNFGYRLFDGIEYKRESSGHTPSCIAEVGDEGSACVRGV